MPFEIIKSGTEVDFIGKWRICVAISCLMLVAGVVGLFVRGVNLGIDFAGGTEVLVKFADGVQVSDGPIRDVVTALDITNPSVVRYGKGGQEYLIKFQGERRIEGASESEGVTPKNDRILALAQSLEQKIGKLEIERTEFVGPKVGAELREDGLKAIGLACVLILIYIAFRFSASFAPGAVVALVHDVFITSSVWVLFGLEFDLRILAAILAILGYSLNDTIIVYDRIRENLELHTKRELVDVLNLSVNQTLSRTLLTSLTTVVAVLALLAFGGDVVRPFALAMVIGIFVGTYSSIYIAAPTLLLLEARKGGSGGSAKARPKTKAKAKAAGA